MRLRTPLAICILMWVCGLLHSVYVVRVGGDFMHGRMLLLPLFTLLLPISVVPLWEWGTKPSWHTLATGATACGLLWWGITTVLGGHNWSMPDQDSAIKDIGIVDEREFWISFSRRPQWRSPHPMPLGVPAGTTLPICLAPTLSGLVCCLLQCRRDWRCACC